MNEMIIWDTAAAVEYGSEHPLARVVILGAASRVIEPVPALRSDGQKDA